MNNQIAESVAVQELLVEAMRLRDENFKLQKALRRVRDEILPRYIPFELQEEIRRALEIGYC
jgi:hypothetical protein